MASKWVPRGSTSSSPKEVQIDLPICTSPSSNPRGYARTITLYSLATLIGLLSSCRVHTNREHGSRKRPWKRESSLFDDGPFENYGRYDVEKSQYGIVISLFGGITRTRQLCRGAKLVRTFVSPVFTAWWLRERLRADFYTQASSVLSLLQSRD